MTNKTLKVSIGVMAYNEGKNIGRFLESLFRQRLKEVCLSEILIVSSGSQDKTNQIIKEFSQKDPRIHLIKQKKTSRQGFSCQSFSETGKRRDTRFVKC